MTDPMFLRIRAACCEEHGLGKDPHALDNHAAHVCSVVWKAKRSKKRKVAA